jgi:choline dehydrogenase
MSFLAKFFGKKEPVVHSLESQSSKHFDYVVIGAGSAGCVVASRLAERNPNNTVALIEAGDRATELEASMPVACGKLQKTKRDWAYKCEPRAC